MESGHDARPSAILQEILRVALGDGEENGAIAVGIRCSRIAAVIATVDDRHLTEYSYWPGGRGDGQATSKRLALLPAALAG
jgi:hypothetical protein